jgi:hypothetical protein
MRKGNSEEKKALLLQDPGFCNRLVTCSSKGELLIILKILHV